MAAGDNDLQALEPLVGAWRIEAHFPNLPPAEGEARVHFEWLPGQRFLVERWQVPVPEAPDGIAVIGPDPAAEGGYLQHYFDTRGVARVYKMSFGDGVWKLWHTRPTSRRSTSASATRAGSAPTVGSSKEPGRSATTAPPGSTTSS